ncbi:MAG TPA: hypothetical protein VMS32_03455 [Verrucomicrobiae bacterium]|jgi:hypothetical protein|nr:hypothetical protein [Verrucomicrobiae bacterium]
MLIATQPLYGAAPPFDSDMRAALRAPCINDGPITYTDRPFVLVSKYTVSGSTLVVRLSVLGAFHADATLISKNRAFGELFLSLDGQPAIEITQFADNGANIFAFRGLANGPHRLVYGLRNLDGVEAYGQLCFVVGK